MHKPLTVMAFIVVLAAAVPAALAEPPPPPPEHPAVGDVVIVGYQTVGVTGGTDNVPAFYWAPLVDLAAGTQIHFTDEGWVDATHLYRNKGRINEGGWIYTAPEGGVKAGTVLNGPGSKAAFEAEANPSGASGASGASGGRTRFADYAYDKDFYFAESENPYMHLDGAGDSVTAYLGSFKEGMTALFILDTGKYAMDKSKGKQTTAIPEGLALGHGAFQREPIGQNIKTLALKPPRSGMTKAELWAYVHNQANWVSAVDANNTVPMPTALTIVP